MIYLTNLFNYYLSKLSEAAIHDCARKVVGSCAGFHIGFIYIYIYIYYIYIYIIYIYIYKYKLSYLVKQLFDGKHSTQKMNTQESKERKFEEKEVKKGEQGYNMYIVVFSFLF